MDNLLVGLTEEQKDRYNSIKDLCLRLYPNVANDKTQMELSHILWRYFAINNKLPDPVKETDEKIEEKVMTEYQTPEDIESTLNKITEEVENVIIN